MPDILQWTQNKSGVSKETTLVIGAKGKYYGTTTIPYKGCFFRRDYSFMNYPIGCLDCKFCYRHKEEKRNIKPKTYLYFSREKYFSNNVYKTPIILSRFCDPNFSITSTKHSYLVMRNILDNSGQFIWRTALDKTNNGMLEMFKQNSNDCQIQLRFISDDSLLGINLRKNLAPKFSSATSLVNAAHRYLSMGIDTVALFDPYIPGVNSSHLIKLFPSFKAAGIDRVIIKQLFPAKFFVEFLKTFASPRYTNFQGISGDYFVYDNIMLLESLYPVVEAAQKYNIELSMCTNKPINDIISTASNCCFFKNPKMTYMELDLVLKEERQRNKALKGDNIE